MVTSVNPKGVLTDSRFFSPASLCIVDIKSSIPSGWLVLHGLSTFPGSLHSFDDHLLGSTAINVRQDCESVGHGLSEVPACQTMSSLPAENWSPYPLHLLRQSGILLSKFCRIAWHISVISYHIESRRRGGCIKANIPKASMMDISPLLLKFLYMDRYLYSFPLIVTSKPSWDFSRNKVQFLRRRMAQR